MNLGNRLLILIGVFLKAAEREFVINDGGSNRGDGVSGADDAVDLGSDFVGGERGEVVGVGSGGGGCC